METFRGSQVLICISQLCHQHRPAISSNIVLCFPALTYLLQHIEVYGIDCGVVRRPLIDQGQVYVLDQELPVSCSAFPYAIIKKVIQRLTTTKP